LTNLDEIATTFRRLVDEMRSNGKPDAIIGFNLDRSKDVTTDLALINLFSPNSLFASGGHFTLKEARDVDSVQVNTLDYPIKNIDRISFEIDVEFDDHGSIQSEAQCIVIDISDGSS